MTLPAALTDTGAAGLAAILSQPGQALLAFDYDGVLAPIVDDPREARPHPRTLAALGRLAGLVGSVAVITGRPAAVVVGLGTFADIPELRDLVVFGHYGRERWDARTNAVLAPPESAAVARARAELTPLLAHLGIVDVTVEDKGASLAVHTRRSADPYRTLDQLREPLTGFAAEHGLIVEPGRFVLELRPPGVDKGSVLREYVAQRHARAVAYAGDDLGDLSAFATVDALREDGVPGLKICSGSPEAVEVAKHADLVVDGPAGIADLLEALATTLTR